MKRLILSVSLITVVSLQAMDGSAPLRAAAAQKEDLLTAVRALTEQVRRVADAGEMRNEIRLVKLACLVRPEQVFLGESGERRQISEQKVEEAVIQLFERRGWLSPIVAAQAQKQEEE